MALKVSCPVSVRQYHGLIEWHWTVDYSLLEAVKEIPSTVLMRLLLRGSLASFTTAFNKQVCFLYFDILPITCHGKILLEFFIFASCICISISFSRFREFSAIVWVARFLVSSVLLSSFLGPLGLGIWSLDLTSECVDVVVKSLSVRVFSFTDDVWMQYFLMLPLFLHTFFFFFLDESNAGAFPCGWVCFIIHQVFHLQHFPFKNVNILAIFFPYCWCCHP